MVKDSAAFDDVVGILQLIDIKNVELLELDVLHLVLTSFPACVGQAACADVYGGNLRMFITAGIDELVSSAASSNQDFGTGRGR